MYHKILLSTLFIAHCANGMSLPLSKIEKSIFLNHVKQLGGKEAALRNIKETKDPTMFFDKEPLRKDWCRLKIVPCFTITTTVYLYKKDKFSRLIINTIKKKEKKKKENFDLPEYLTQEYDAVQEYGTQKLYPRYKFLENYTKYRHLIDRAESQYIELVSNFTDKEALLDVLQNNE